MRGFLILKKALISLIIVILFFSITEIMLRIKDGEPFFLFSLTKNSNEYNSLARQPLHMAGKILEKENGEYHYFHKGMYGDGKVRKFKLTKQDPKVFIYGGSSVASMYGKKTLPLIEGYWKNLSNYKVKIYNFGVGGRDSQIILETVEKTLQFEPSLLIIYAGHNDIAREIKYTYGGSSRIHEAAQTMLDKSKVLQELYKLSLIHMNFNESEINISALWVNTTPILDIDINDDFPKNRAEVVKMTKAFQGRIKTSEDNAINTFIERMERIIRLCSAKSIPVLFITPVSNPYRFEGYVAEICENCRLEIFVDDFYKAKGRFLNKTLTEDELKELLSEYPNNGFVSALAARFYFDKGDINKTRFYEKKTINQNYRSHEVKEEMNSAIRNLKNETNKIYVLDFNSYLFNASNFNNSIEEFFLPDYLHPNERLYRIIGDKVKEFIIKKNII